MAEKLAYTIPEAAQKAGISERSLRRIIATGDLVPHYPLGGGRKTVILHDDLKDWLKSTPTEPT